MRLSASKLGLGFKCLWWAREDVALPAQESSEAANSGTNKHKALEFIVEGAISIDPFASLWGCAGEDARSILDAIDAWLRPWLNSGTVFRELALAYCPSTDTARKLESRGQRDYSSLKRGEIPMTIDLAVAQDFTSGLVVDYKTGRQDGLDPVDDSAQLSLCALAFARAFGLDEVDVAYALVADDGSARIERCLLDSFDLASVAETVRATMTRLADDPQPCPGEHCKTKWCPARAVCPATIGLAKATPELAPLVVRINSAEQCAWAHSRLTLAEDFLTSVKVAVKDFVYENGPVLLDDGSSLMLVEKTRETLDIDGNEKAIAALKKALGPAFERAVNVKISASKESLKAATAQLAKGKERTALERGILEELQTCNAVKLSTFETVEVVRDRKRKAG
jgi:hypothetical protein